MTEAFHGFAPLKVVDDVINSFNDCARPSNLPLALARSCMLLTVRALASDVCDGADAMEGVLGEHPELHDEHDAIKKVRLARTHYIRF